MEKIKIYCEEKTCCKKLWRRKKSNTDDVRPRISSRLNFISEHDSPVVTRLRVCVDNFILFEVHGMLNICWFGFLSYRIQGHTLWHF